MLANNFKKSLLAAKVGLILGTGVTGVAFAEENQTGVKEDVEVIEVRGIRRSLEASLNTKRFADSVVDAVTAEDIGKFPDKNIAESLKRVPGITVQGQFGEGDAVSIRGAGSDFTKTTLNGQNVASTGWFVLEPAKRSFNYTLLPSELVGGLEVYKSSQADIIEGGVGGTVVVKTRTPLDMDPNTIYGSLEFQHSDDSGETDPQFSGMYSWKNDSEDLGFLFSAVNQTRQLQRQGNEAFWAWGAGPVGFEQERERTAFTTTFEYAPSDSVNIVVNYLDMKMDANNTNFAVWLTRDGEGKSTAFIHGDGTEATPGTPMAGDLGVAFYQMRPREATMNSDYLDIKLEYTGDNYKLELVAGDTNSSGGTDFEMVMNDSAPMNLTGTYDFTSGHQKWQGVDLANYVPGVTEDMPNGSLTMGTGTNFNATPKTDEEQFFQADFEYMLESDLITSIKAGFRYGEHEATSRRFEFTQSAGFDPVYSLDGQGLGAYDVGADNLTMQAYDVDAMKRWAKASITGRTEDFGAYSHIKEENTALYLMAKYSGEKYRGNFGVRYVSTDASSIYYKGAVATARTSEDSDYSEVLPSFNLAYDLQEDMILRFAAAKVMTRPQYNDMYFNPSLEGVADDLPDNQKVILGNPGLVPFTANQAEAGVEWYFNSTSLVAATVFYKDVSNFIVINRRDAIAEDIQKFGLPTLSNTPTQNGDSEAQNGWEIEENFNGPGGKVKGVELQYQQDFGNGFGTLVNYTYTKGEADNVEFVNGKGETQRVFSDGGIQLTDSSKYAYNATAYYENEDFYARISYNYRSDYMIRETGAYGNRLHHGFGSIDLSAVYHFNENIDFKFDVVNLTGESSEQYGNHQYQVDNSGYADGFPLFEYEQATRYSLGVSVRY
ncbi:TonB-dependent receptor [Pseudoalteromonas sp. DL2-H2.2]|uniref:TonB-dependent receptor n=1 Tax=Pseudoalteromonas sp. DL2-H2.2 TaxID=2908889 RepID=UPI001F434150|nr:TonB-dependent receptor [Pseudoalteromonas sp. DL2-H2.2]MCF2908185.1 TonB-dependent receptor [Pseudoalteromonas sp. DL2-H2.2]